MGTSSCDATTNSMTYLSLGGRAVRILQSLVGFVVLTQLEVPHP